MWSEINI